jgi:hypothetical protein
MTKEKAGEAPANEKTTSNNYTDETAISQGWRIVEHLKQFGRLSTLEARRVLGIMNPSQRVSELRKRGLPIDTGRTYQADETGAVHSVAVYIWRGDNSSQCDLFEGVSL